MVNSVILRGRIIALLLRPCLLVSKYSKSFIVDVTIPASVRKFGRLGTSMIVPSLQNLSSIQLENPDPLSHQIRIRYHKVLFSVIRLLICNFSLTKKVTVWTLGVSHALVMRHLLYRSTKTRILIPPYSNKVPVKSTCISSLVSKVVLKVFRST